MDGLLQIEDCLDADGAIVLPPGVTLISLIDRNIANVGDSVAYRYLDVGPRRMLQKLYNTPEKKAARPWAPTLN